MIIEAAESKELIKTQEEFIRKKYITPHEKTLLRIEAKPEEIVEIEQLGDPHIIIEKLKTVRNAPILLENLEKHESDISQLLSNKTGDQQQRIIEDLMISQVRPSDDPTSNIPIMHNLLKEIKDYYGGRPNRKLKSSETVNNFKEKYPDIMKKIDPDDEIRTYGELKKSIERGSTKSRTPIRKRVLVKFKK